MAEKIRTLSLSQILLVLNETPSSSREGDLSLGPSYYKSSALTNNSPPPPPTYSPS